VSAGRAAAFVLFSGGVSPPQSVLAQRSEVS